MRDDHKDGLLDYAVGAIVTCAVLLALFKFGSFVYGAEHRIAIRDEERQRQEPHRPECTCKDHKHQVSK